MVQAPCSFTVQEIADKLNSNLSNGLDRETVLKHRQTFGPNQILQDGPKKRWKILADQFIDPIIYILTAAAILAFLFSDLLEGFAIVIVIFISVAIGFFMELQAVRSLEALRKLGQVMTCLLYTSPSPRDPLRYLVCRLLLV